MIKNDPTDPEYSPNIDAKLLSDIGTVLSQSGSGIAINNVAVIIAVDFEGNQVLLKPGDVSVEKTTGVLSALSVNEVMSLGITALERSNPGKCIMVEGRGGRFHFHRG